MVAHTDELSSIRFRKPPLFKRLYSQLVLFGALALAAAVLLFAFVTSFDQSAFALKSIRTQATTQASNIALAASNYIVAEDFGALEQLLLQSTSFEDVLAIKVVDVDGDVVGNITRASDGVPIALYDVLTVKLPLSQMPVLSVVDKVLTVWSPVENGTLGWVRLDYSLASVDVAQSRIWRNGIITAVSLFAMSMLLLIYFLKKPMRAILNATQFARQLYRSDGQIMQVQSSSFEIEQLEHSLNFASRKIFATNKDLTDMKSALDAHAVVGICDCEGKLSYVNDRFCDITGYSREELIGNDYGILNTNYHSESFYQHMWARLRAGHVWNGEMRDQCKNGDSFWVDTTLVPFLDDEGRPYQYVGIQTDITERKLAERENARLGKTLDESVNEVYVCDIENLNILQVNKGAQKNLGYQSDSLNHMNLAEINAEYDLAAMKTLLNSLLEDNSKQLKFETLHKRRDGSSYAVEMHIQISWMETPAVLVAIVLDISERKEAELELRAYQEHLEEMVEERTNKLQVLNRELESFCYSVSHDLRAPLRSIDGFSLALLEDYNDDLEDQAQNYLHRVRAASQRMGELIDDLLDLSRVVRSDMNVSEVDLSNLAMRAFKQLQEIESDRRVEFVTTKGLLAKGDSRLLLAVLENLLGNAWKFTANSQAAKIEFNRQQIDGKTVYFVRDNGAGFDQSYAHKMFEPFQRLHTTEEYEGTGIGLATVQRIVRRHGGNIWADGEVGVGATIYFSLGEQ